MNKYLVLLIITISILTTNAKADLIKITQDMVQICIGLNRISVPFDRKEMLKTKVEKYSVDNGLTTEAVVCSLLIIVNDNVENPEKWKKIVPKYYDIENEFKFILLSMRYKPIREELLNKFKKAKCIGQMGSDYNVFYISKDNWFNICDSIIRDTITYCDITRYSFYHKTIPKLFINDSNIISGSYKDSLFKLLCTGMRIQRDPNDKIYLDSLCSVLLPDDYKKSTDRIKFITGVFELQCVKNTILRYPSIRQKKINEKILQYKKMILKENAIGSSPKVKECFNCKIDFIQADRKPNEK
jgi:hypothetical protein